MILPCGRVGGILHRTTKDYTGSRADVSAEEVDQSVASQFLNDSALQVPFYLSDTTTAVITAINFKGRTFSVHATAASTAAA